MKALIKKIKKHITAELFAGLVGFIACAPFSGFGIRVAGAAGLAMIAFFMLNSEQG
jgi:hypothetical protein